MNSTIQAQSFVFEIRKRNTLLFRLGIIDLILAVLLLLLIPFDPREIAGVSIWVKPIKFAISFGLYLLTFAWILEYLKISQKKLQFLSQFIAFCMILEITALVLQAARGTPYHFNLSQPLSAAICYNMCLFMIANLLIIANTLAVTYVLYLFFKETEPLPPSYLWGIRLGIGIFLLSCLEGAFIVFHNTHCIEQPVHGSLGLPFISKSNLGDLRPSHFLGIHAMQVLPLIGYGLKDKVWGKMATFLSALIYLGLFSTLLIQALIWIPFISCVKPE